MKGGEKMTKKTVFTTIAVTVIGAGLLTASNAFAQSTSTDQTDPMSSLVKKIAQKFNLNETEVQKVFDEEHEERHAQMEAAFEKQLSQYVTDGKITEDQKKLILEKHKELKAEREQNKDSFKNMTPEERRTQMESKKTELDAWAKENGIDPQYLMPRGGKGGPMGRHGGFGPRDDDQQTSVTTTPAQ